MLFAEWLRKLKAQPEEERTNAAAARVIDLWHARQAPGAEPLLVHTIAIAARAGRPWLSYQCPACTMISEADVRSFERHPHASIQILIPALSCPLPRRALCEAHRPSGVTGSFGAAALADTWTACRASSRQRLASAR